MKPKALYVHIPFCQHLCHYCDFTKVIYNEEWANKYLNALKDELVSYQIDECSSIYVGGGTPSALNIKQLEILLSLLKPYIDENCEFTIEVNPETLNRSKIKLLKAYGINRVSIGVQTFNESILHKFGRKHNNNDVFNVIKWLNEEGIENYSFDLIYGLEHTRIEDLRADLEIAFSNNVKHLSLYSLTIESHTKFSIDGVNSSSDDELRTRYDFILNYLNSRGFIHYEVSNFAINESHFSKHNLIYWTNKEYYGIGLGASGYLNGIRYQNTKSLTNYLNRNYRHHEEAISLKDKEFEYIMLNLRTIYGIDLNEFNSLFGKDFKSFYKNEIDYLLNLNLIEITSTHVKVSNDNYYILDSIISKFINKL